MANLELRMVRSADPGCFAVCISCLFNEWETAPWLARPVSSFFCEHISYILDERLCGSPCGDVFELIFLSWEGHGLLTQLVTYAASSISVNDTSWNSGRAEAVLSPEDIRFSLCQESPDFADVILRIAGSEKLGFITK